jgi:hypothetical protein
MSSESYISIIKKRKSKRSYLNKALSSIQIEQINSILSQDLVGPFGNRACFQLIVKKTVKENHEVKLGTYGFISGARYFILGQIKEGRYANEDYGYIFEKIILDLTALELGTCWLGGTFSRKGIAQVLDLEEGKIIPAITPVGQASETFSKRESLIRWGAKSDSRKAWDELFFKTEFAQPLTEEDAGEYHIPIEMLRLSPSASNKQSWRILKTDKAFHFYLKRTPGYQKIIKSTDLQKMDLGICMAHFELACNELELKGNWLANDPGISSELVDEYCLSWVF